MTVVEARLSSLTVESKESRERVWELETTTTALQKLVGRTNRLEGV